MIYTCINYPIPGLVHICFVYNDSHLSLNNKYIYLTPVKRQLVQYNCTLNLMLFCHSFQIKSMHL